MTQVIKGMMALTLYGINGTNDGNTVQGCRDIYRIFKNDPDVQQTGVAPGNEPYNGKLQFGSGVLDVTIRNLSDSIEAEVDIYTGWFRKSQDNTAVLGSRNPVTDFSNPSAITPIAPGNTGTQIYERGTTLFDGTTALSKTGFHIHRKTKSILAPTQSMFLQHRDPKNHMIDWVRDGVVGYAKKGLTYGMIIVWKPSVLASSEAIVPLAVGTTRKYTYAVVEDNLDRVCKNPPL
ncbi:putative capsid protein [Sakkuthvirus batchis]|uniref:Putative capsid protein n=1 Tax=Bat circovirus ZS/China/2011 TaxID=1072162 RepID=G1D7G1_9CIRC|nr:putative capsid protein [Bat circovirus ZS/China/2011]